MKNTTITKAVFNSLIQIAWIIEPVNFNDMVILTNRDKKNKEPLTTLQLALIVRYQLMTFGGTFLNREKESQEYENLFYILSNFYLVSNWNVEYSGE